MDVGRLLADNPGLTAADLRDAIDFHMRHAVSANPLGNAGNLLLAHEAAAESTAGGGGDGDAPSSGLYPEAFRCICEGRNSYRIINPYVCTPTGTIQATGGIAGVGTYYCNVRKDDDGYSAKITDDEKPDDDGKTVVIVPIAEITANDGIHQYHIGTIIVAGGGDTSSRPFDLISREKEEDDGNGEDGAKKKTELVVVRCEFIWNGEPEHLDEFVVDDGSEAVYLVATQPQQSSSGEPEWEFELAVDKGEAPESGRVLNYKLYDLDEGKVSCDYRSTFMELNSPHKVCKFVVEREDDQQHPSVDLDAADSAGAKVCVTDRDSRSANLVADGTSVYLELSDTDSGKYVNIDPTDLSDEQAKFHKLTVVKADGTETQYDVLASSDITVKEGGSSSGDRITDVEIELSEGVLRLVKTIVDSDGNERTERSDGITLKTLDVVTESSYLNAEFSNEKASVTVLDQSAAIGETVFTAIPHSSVS